MVTGAAGFIGAAVGGELKALGARFVGVTRRDIVGMTRVESYTDAPTGDVLVHLAEDNNRSRVAERGESYEHEVVTATAALLRKGFRRVVYVSSAALYSDRYETARRPGDAVHVVDAYTRVKRSCETLVLDSDAGVVVRPSNVYGLGMSSQNVVSTMLARVAEPGPLVVRDTAPVRDFVWIADAAAGIARVALGETRGIFNVGSGVATSIMDLAKMTLGIYGQPDREVRSSACASDRSSLVLDVSLTEQTFGYRPVVSLREGLTNLITSRQ